jgi:mono/diheme cytochrome c family protein
MLGMGAVLLVTACAHAGAAEPTRQPMSAANAIATATVRAGGTPGGTQAAFADTSPVGQLFGQNCATCHAVKAGGGNLGPSLITIGAEAATRKPGMDAAAYIRESIVAPNTFVVQGYQPNVMPTTYGTSLTPEQIDQLVNYLLEQK